MKFNERELATWASTFTADKEGLLEKRGAGISYGMFSYVIGTYGSDIIMHVHR